MSNDVQKWLSEQGIHNYTTTAKVKAPNVERFIRTLRKVFGRYFTWTENNRWIEFLPKFISNYNNRLHSTTKCRPLDLAMDPMLIPKNTTNVPLMTSWNLPPIGSFVRLNVNRGIFEKEGEGTWSTEVFLVVRNKLNQPIPMVVLEDLNGEEIEGSFYPEEVQSVEWDGVKEAEEVLETRNVDGVTEYLVAYKGWPDEFNEWTREEPVIDDYEYSDDDDNEYVPDSDDDDVSYEADSDD